MHGWTEDIRQQQRRDLLHLWSGNCLIKCTDSKKFIFRVNNYCWSMAVLEASHRA
jgi:hypothetical protein